MWSDTDKQRLTTFDRSLNHNKNYTRQQRREGIIYETSYNASVQEHHFHMAMRSEFLSDTGFPASALYIARIGADSRCTAGSFVRTLVLIGQLLLVPTGVV